MQPPLMSTELFGGMFSYVEAKHMLAISLRVCVRVCVLVCTYDITVQIAFTQTHRVRFISFSSPTGLQDQSPILLTRSERTGTFLEDMAVLRVMAL